MTVTGLKDIPKRPALDARRRIANAVSGHAVIDHVELTGAVRDGNPEVELRLTVDLPGRDRYRASLRQVLSGQVVHTLHPGLELAVTVDAEDPSRLEIG